jgi:ribulose kinase
MYGFREASDCTEPVFIPTAEYVGIVIGRMPSPRDCPRAALRAVVAPAVEVAAAGCFGVAGVAGAGALALVMGAGACKIAPVGEDRACAAGAGVGLKPA